MTLSKHFISFIWLWPWIKAKTHWAIPFSLIANIIYHNLKHLSPIWKIYGSKGLYYLACGSVKDLYFYEHCVCIGSIFFHKWYVWILGNPEYYIVQQLFIYCISFLRLHFLDFIHCNIQGPQVGLYLQS